jgi:hypothetical protein
MRYIAKETVAVALGRIVGYRRVAGIKHDVERQLSSRT